MEQKPYNDNTGSFDVLGKPLSVCLSDGICMFRGCVSLPCVTGLISWPRATSRRIGLSRWLSRCLMPGSFSASTP